MSWSYSGDPATSMRDAVRFLISDTNEADQLISDQELDWVIAVSGDTSVYQAAHDACYHVASMFTRLATSTSVGDMSISYSDRSAGYFTLADELLELGARRNVPTPWVAAAALQRAVDKSLPPGNGTEFWTGQMDYDRNADIFRPTTR